MTTKYSCALDGVSLSSLDGRVFILDIQEEAPRQRLSTFLLPQGGRQLSPVRENLTVRVTFAIQQEQPPLRRTALQKVLAWAAKGGVLTTSDHPRQQLTVVCSEYPAMSAENWTEPLTLCFTTTRCPFWEDAEPSTLTADSTGTFSVPGTADFAPVSVTVTNTANAAITRLSLQCGATWLIFEGIHLPAGSTCHVDAANGLLSAFILGESILGNLTPSSNDLLLAPCGKDSRVQALGDQTLTATWSARGRYA